MPTNDYLKNPVVTPDLSVVILCYESKEQIFSFVNNIRSSFQKNGIQSYELILVANYQAGTQDSTPEYARQIARTACDTRCICRAKKGMMGWDMKSGLEIARGNYISIIDGDGQMPAEDIVRIFHEIRQGGFDLVKTYRLTRGDGLWRKSISQIYNIAFNIIFPGLHSRDINSKPKIFTREFFERLELESDDWFIDAEIMINARRMNARIKEIPTDFKGLCGERKSFVRPSAIFEFIRNFTIFRYKEFQKIQKDR